MSENPTRVAVDADLIDLLRAWREQWNDSPGLTANDTDVALMKAVDALPDVLEHWCKTRAQACVILTCVECGRAYEEDGITWHFHNLEGALEVAENEGWTVLGRTAVCGGCVDNPHGFVGGGVDPEECQRCGLDEDDHKVATAGAVNG